MIKAYLTAVPAFFEGEDIEIIYTVTRDGEEIKRYREYKDYQKPSLAEHFALVELLKYLNEIEEKEIDVIFNNPSLLEQLNGTSTLRDNKAKKLIERVHDRIGRMNKHVYFTDVSTDADEIEKWNKML